MADRYWVGGTANWDATAGTKWALTSGGAGGQAVPTSADNVFFDAASGAVTVTITATANCDSLNFTGFTGTIAGTSALNVYGSLTLSTGMTRSYSGTLSMLATATGKTITSNGKTLANITFAGAGGGWTLQDAFTTTGNINHTNGTLDTNGVAVSCLSYLNTGTATRTLTLGATTWTTGTATSTGWSISSATGMTLNAGTSKIVIASVGTAGAGFFSGAGLTYYNVEFSTTSISGFCTISGTNTFNNLTVVSPSSTGIKTVSINANQTINGLLNCAGASLTQRVCLQTSAGFTSSTLTVASLSGDNCDYRRITLSGAASPASPAGAGDCGGNTGITFPAAKTVYWNLSGTQNWGATGWATTSGGSPAAANFPLVQDTAIFNNSGSTGTVQFLSNWNVGTIDASARTSSYTFQVSQHVYVHKDLIISTGASFTQNFSFFMYRVSGAQTISCNGGSFANTIEIGDTTQIAPTVEFGSNFLSTARLTLTRGSLNALTYNVECLGFTQNAGTLSMGSGTWTLTGAGSVWTYSAGTFNKDTANIVLSNTTTSARTFAGGGQTYNKLTIGGTTGTSTLTLTGSNTFSEIASTKTVAHTITFTSGTTTTVTTWSVNGTSGNLVSIRASTAGSRATLAKAGGGTVTVDYADIKDSTASPVSTWYATNSVDSGNNLNWNILAATAAFLMFFS